MKRNAEYEVMRLRAEEAERKLALIKSWHEVGYIGVGYYDVSTEILPMLDKMNERTKNIRILLGIELPPPGT